jgi:hypothetical protein
MVFVWSLVPSIWLAEFIAHQASWLGSKRTTVFRESGNMLAHTWSQDCKSHLPRRKCGHHRIFAYFPRSVLKSRKTWKSRKVTACKSGHPTTRQDNQWQSSRVSGWSTDFQKSVANKIARLTPLFYSKTNQMHNTSNLFYCETKFYMFRTVFPPIIRSLRLYIQHQIYVIQVLWLLASK